MANNAASAIRTSLVTHLSAVSELKQVKVGRTADFSSGFPACRLYLSAIENALKDNAPSNWRTYVFAVEVIQHVKAGNESTDEATFEAAVDAVLDKLAAEWTLSSNADVVEINAGGVEYRESPQGVEVSCILLVNVRTLIS